MRTIEGKEDDSETHSRHRLPSVGSALRRGHRRTTGRVRISEQSLKMTAVRTTADSTSLGRVLSSVKELRTPVTGREPGGARVQHLDQLSSRSGECGHTVFGEGCERQVAIEHVNQSDQWVFYRDGLLDGPDAQVIIDVITTLDKSQEGVDCAVQSVQILRINEVRREKPRIEESGNQPWGQG
jgi:hypothetical protein